MRRWAIGGVVRGRGADCHEANAVPLSDASGTALLGSPSGGGCCGRDARDDDGLEPIPRQRLAGWRFAVGQRCA